MRSVVRLDRIAANEHSLNVIQERAATVARIILHTAVFTWVFGAICDDVKSRPAVPDREGLPLAGERKRQSLQNRELAGCAGDGRNLDLPVERCWEDGICDFPATYWIVGSQQELTHPALAVLSLLHAQAANNYFLGPNLGPPDSNQLAHDVVHL